MASLELPSVGFSLLWPPSQRGTDSKHVGSVVVALGLSCSEACEIHQIGDQTHVPCIGRLILNPWATSEV